MAQSSFRPGVVDYSDDPILPPWYVPGWTAQNAEQPAFAIPAPPNNINTFTNLPGSLVFVNVTGNYTDGMGNNLGGYLTFEQSNDLVATVNGIAYRIPARLVGNISTTNQLAWNAQGSGKVYIQFGVLNCLLLATDNAGITIMEPTGDTAPATWVYHVKEYFYRGYMYDISVPSTTSPVDISTLIVPGTLQLNPDWNRGY